MLSKMGKHFKNHMLDEILDFEDELICPKCGSYKYIVEEDGKIYCADCDEELKVRQ